MKIYVASFNRASDGAISKLRDKLISEDMITQRYSEADYILAVGDRSETFDFCLQAFRDNIPIIHLWAGEISQGTHDEVYRHAITLMSDIQLCTNKTAAKRVKDLCSSVDKFYKVFIVGNVMLDNMDTFMSKSMSEIPETEYDVVLYNPPTRVPASVVIKELQEINDMLDKPYVWIESNGDMYSDLVNKFVNTKTLDRDIFLWHLYHCDRFITNSSCAYYEGQFLVDKDKLIMIGERNKNRESKYGDMTGKNASENIMSILRKLK